MRVKVMKACLAIIFYLVNIVTEIKTSKNSQYLIGVHKIYTFFQFCNLNCKYIRLKFQQQSSHGMINNCHLLRHNILYCFYYYTDIEKESRCVNHTTYTNYKLCIHVQKVQIQLKLRHRQLN